MNKCVWTFNEQKCLEVIRNWRTRNLGLYDDFRPLFDNFPEFQEIFLKKYTFFEKFSRQNRKDLLYPASVLLSRTLAYCQSTEFITSNKKI